MPTLELSPGNSLAYDLIEPDAGRHTFVCFNALSGDKDMWLTTVGDALRAAGHGLLIHNLRGQSGSAISGTNSQDNQVTVASITDDAMALLDHVRPVRPIHVGLSIGGLFSLNCHLRGGAGHADGIALINTLRKQTTRLDWINDAVVRAVETGGFQLMKDLYFPLLMNLEWQTANRQQFLAPLAKGEAYQPAEPSDPTVMLMKSGSTADWAVDYEAITVPVLSISGLQDRVFYDAADVDELCRRLPRCERLDMPDAGHMVPLERPDALAKALLAFAERLN